MPIPPRPALRRAVIAAAVALLVSVSLACGQTVPTPDAGGAVPIVTTDRPALVPDRNAPPSIEAAPSDAEEATPPAAPAVTSRDPGAPNYGGARQRKSNLYAPALKSAPPLSPLVPYKSSVRQQRGVARRVNAATTPSGVRGAPPNPAPPPKDLLYPLLPGPSYAAVAFPQRNSPPVAPADAEAFEPTGLRVGDLRLKPFVEASTGYETNPNQVQVGVRPSAELRVDAGTAIESDFSNHSLTGMLRGGYSLFPSNSTADRPDISALLDGRIDVTRDSRINTEARLTLLTQTPGSPLLAVPNSVFITSRPLIASAGVTLGAAHDFGRLTLDLRSTFDRMQYGNASQSDGTEFLYSQDNYNAYGIVARASYEVQPGLVPFVETGVDARVRDNPVDLSGFLRDSRGVLARVGSSFSFYGHLTGTGSVGYADRHYQDPRLSNLRGPTADGTLSYAVTPLTTVTLRASTTLSETTLAGSSGAISRLVSLEIAHVLFRHFTISGIATYQPNEYQGVGLNEMFTQFTLKGAYAFNREVSVIASASQQNLNSALIGQGFKDSIFLVGVRLQR